MTVDAVVVMAVLQIIVGLLILAFPAMLRFLVGGYLVVVGVLSLIVSTGAV